MPEKKRNRIVLTGFMGTGKTAVGELLAKKLKFSFLDTDRMVEKKTGLNVAEIFEKKGEAYFRMLEKEMIQKALENEKIVLATGGGAVIDPENLILLKQKGFMIALQASPEIIQERLKQFQNRPLLSKEEEPLKKIKELLSTRSPFYKQADKILDTSGKNIETITEEILEILK